MSNDHLFVNGINGASGDLLLPPLTMEQVAAVVARDRLDASVLDELQTVIDRVRDQAYEVFPGLDPGDLAQVGWGVIFARGADPALKEALKELLDHRRSQAGALYREFSDFPDRPRKDTDTPYAPPERKHKFLERHKVGPAVVKPEKMPYYLLLVGNPQEMPYSFQEEMDVQYATGRVWFEKDGKPDLEAFTRYAGSVVQADRQPPPARRRGVFFGVQNSGDAATGLSAQHLVAPLAEYAREEFRSWHFDTVLGEQATKSRLARLLGGDDTPAFLFTASHGMGFPDGDPRQRPHQGALLCQDWPGFATWGRKPIPPEHYFAADDVAAAANLRGLIAFFFACYGGGTPQFDEFAHRALNKPTPIAPCAFVAGLPQRLLAHDKGGALAVVAHVDRAWGFSFFWGKAGSELTTFEATLHQLLRGLPLGHAVEPFNQRYADLATTLSRILEEIQLGLEPDRRELAMLWTANNDARNYVILGDPAVRLPAAT